MEEIKSISGIFAWMYAIQNTLSSESRFQLVTKLSKTQTYQLISEMGNPIKVICLLTTYYIKEIGTCPFIPLPCLIYMYFKITKLPTDIIKENPTKAICL